MCVARRSRNQRSWLTTTAQPTKFATRFFERPQRVDVEVVRRFVEQQHVRAAAEQLGEVDAVAFTAGEDADLLLLVGAGEVEPRDVRPGVHLAAAHFDVVEAAGDFLVDGLVADRGRRAI